MTASVSVVVPVLDATRTLPVCLGALARLEPAPAEIVLVDNGSTDGSLDLLRAFADHHPGVRVVEEPRRGAAAARNAGIRAATGDLVAFTDADCEPAPSWLASAVAPFDDPLVGAVAGRVVSAPARSLTELFSALFTLQAPDRPARVTRWTPWEGGYPTANLLARRRLLEALEGFDERISIYGEDYDLCARLYAAGGAIVYEPNARVAHHHRTTIAGMLRQGFGFGRSHALLLARHADRGLWLDLPGRSMAWAGCPARAWIDLASADKKILALLALSGLWRPALVLLLLYAVWLAVATGRRASRAGAAVSRTACVGLAALLVLKSAAMTAGRWWGSVRYGVVCL